LRTVGVIGCQPRIGTTTQALQIVLCLQGLGYRAAYVEMGEHDYLKNLVEIYEDVTIDKYNVIRCRSIPMYTGKQIILANQHRYDYLVKDYGYIDSPDYTIAYFEQDIRVVVGGTKANEIEYMERVIEDPGYLNVSYIFSFVAQSEQKDVKELMGDKKENTYFAMYTPDPFTYTENDIYEYVLGTGHEV